jgi:hypothetical protein
MIMKKNSILEVFFALGLICVWMASSCSLSNNQKAESRGVETGAEDPQEENKPPVTQSQGIPQSEPTYLNFVSNQMTTNCLGCHAGENKQKVSLDQYGERGAATTILLWDKVVGQIVKNRMPMAAPLSDELKKVFSRWKDLGFPFDDVDLKTSAKSRSTDYCSVETLLPARLWRLTDRQVASTIRNAFGDPNLVGVTFPITPRSGGHFNHTNGALAIGQNEILAQLTLAEAVSAAVVSKDATIRSCINGSGTDCIKQVIQTYAPKLWRRPVTEEEVATIAANADDAMGKKLNRQEGIQLVVETMLNSQNFWYRSEVGQIQSNGERQLTAYELASFLSYTIWDGPPDAALTTVAANGTLLNDDVLRAQVIRLSQSANAKAGLFRFFDEWLNLTTVVGIDKSDSSFTGSIRNSLVKESQSYVDEFGFNKNQPLAEFFSNPRTMGDSQVALFYGTAFNGSTSSSIVPIELDPKERAGILTHASFIASNSGYSNTNIVRRGYTLLSEILCSELSPPPNVIDATAKVAEDPKKPMTSRQRLEKLHTSNPACSSCHSILDPLGSSLENYDPTGKYRTIERSLTIDASGVLTNFSDANGKFKDGVEMVRQVTSSQYFAECASNKYFQYAFGVKVSDAQKCDANRALSSFTASGQKVRQMPEMLLNTRSLKFRK